MEIGLKQKMTWSTHTAVISALNDVDFKMVKKNTFNSEKQNVGLLAGLSKEKKQQKEFYY